MKRYSGDASHCPKYLAPCDNRPESAREFGTLRLVPYECRSCGYKFELATHKNRRIFQHPDKSGKGGC